jgi:hypothetical protein
MTPQVWAATGAVLLLAALAWTLMVVPAGERVEMRSQHSEPAATLPQQPVVVTAAGKQFHAARCTFVHGKPETISAQEAVRRGYTPDPRCMKQALSH